MSTNARPLSVPLSAIALCAIIYAWFLSFGTFELFGEALRARAFDSLALSILEGRADVDPDAITWEGYEIRGRRYMYFGIFPALLRLPLLLIFPETYGGWPRLSVLVALTGAVAAFASSARLALAERQPDSLSRDLLTASVVAFGLASPLVYLAASARIYHEAMAWGLFWHIWAVRLYLGAIWDRGEATSQLAGLSICAAGALLSRATFAPSSYLLLALAACKALAGRRSGLGATLACALPALAGIALQLWYNYARFGAISTFHHPSYIEVEPLGGVFNLARVPDALYNYLFPRAAAFLPHRPFVVMPKPHYFDQSIFFFWKEEAFPLSIGSVWLILGAAAGLAALGRVRAPRWLAAALLAHLPQALLMLGYYAVNERYSAELLAPLVIAYLAYLAAGPGSRSARAQTLAAVPISILLSLVATLGWCASAAGETGLPLSYQERLARALYGRLPPPGSGTGFEPLSSDYAVFETHDLTKAFFYQRRERDLVRVLGISIDRAIVMQANSQLIVKAPEGAQELQFVLGLMDFDPRCTFGAAQLYVLDGAGDTLYSSGVRYYSEAPRYVSVPLQGARLVSLVVLQSGSGQSCDIMVLGSSGYRMAGSNG